MPSISPYSYLGQGEKFPLEPDVNSKPLLVSGMDSIKQSFHDILSTPLGERFFNELYGSEIHEMLFEQNDIILYSLIWTFTLESLVKWERRAEILSVEMNILKEKAEIEIRFREISTNMIDTFVYPFYREIAT